MSGDVKFMRRALRLAKRGLGSASPNPMVGAVVVRNGIVAGEGWHNAPGGPHAEVEALRAAAGNTKNADLYVTLEPCSTTGRTPPCVDAVIAAGISRVFVGCLDPNPKHNGKGVATLRKAGIETFVGMEEEKCVRLNKAFSQWITTGRPYVLLKIASTLDGKIATSAGESKWITGPTARKRVMELRRWADAIMVGGATARKDTPSLSVRDGKKRVQPKRLVVSRSMSLNEAVNALAPGLAPEVIAASSKSEWLNVLRSLGNQEITALLVEGGGNLAASLLRANIVDEVEFHFAPRILGGRRSIPSVGGDDPSSLLEAIELEQVETRRLGRDMAVTGRPAMRVANGDK